MRKELWDRQGANMSLEGNVWGKAVSASKKGILERDQHLFAVLLSQMDLTNVDRWKM